MGASPLRGWNGCFVLSDPRVETRGYSPLPLRGSPFPPPSHSRQNAAERRDSDRRVSHGVAQSCSRGFQPAGRCDTARCDSHGVATWRMGASPLRGWSGCFVSSGPRVETRGYSPVPLRGSPFPPPSHSRQNATERRDSDRRVSHGVAQSCSRGFQPADGAIPSDVSATEWRSHVAAGFNPRGGAIPTDVLATKWRSHVAAGFNPRDGVMPTDTTAPEWRRGGWERRPSGAGTEISRRPVHGLKPVAIRLCHSVAVNPTTESFATKRRRTARFRPACQPRSGAVM